MGKLDYIGDLKRNLRALPDADVREILADYEEHFDAARSAGKSEADIITGLGPAKTVAQGYLMNNLIKEVSSSPSTIRRSGALIGMMMLFLVLAPFNFLVIVGPFLILACLLLAGWCIPITMTGVAIAALVTFFVAGSTSVLGTLQGFSLCFMLLGTIGISALIAMVMILLSRGMIQLVSSYIRWNYKIIVARRA